MSAAARIQQREKSLQRNLVKTKQRLLYDLFLNHTKECCCFNHLFVVSAVR